MLNRFCEVLCLIFPQAWGFLEQYALVCTPRKQKVLQEFQFNESLPYTPPLCDVIKKISLRNLAYLRQVDNYEQNTHFSTPPILLLLCLALTKPTLILSAYLPLPLVLLSVASSSNQIYRLYANI